MKIGDKVWMFDMNRRVYPKNSGMSASPIYSEYFYQVIIEGETSRSWVIGKNKFRKENPSGLYTDEQKAEKIWDNENRYKIVDKIRNCSIAKLQLINSIIEKKNESS